MCMVLCQEFEESLPSGSLLSNYGGVVYTENVSNKYGACERYRKHVMKLEVCIWCVLNLFSTFQSVFIANPHNDPEMKLSYQF